MPCKYAGELLHGGSTDLDIPEPLVNQIRAVDRREDRGFGKHRCEGQQHSLSAPHLIEPVVDERDLQIAVLGYWIPRLCIQ